MFERPADSTGEIERSRTLLLGGNADAAIAVLEPLACAGAASAEAHFLLGASRHMLGDLAGALASFDAALARNPEHLEAAQAALGMLCALGRAGEALERANALLAAHPHDPQLNFNAALVHEALGDWAAALARYDAALAADPVAVLPRLNRGLALTRLGRPEEAYANNRALALAQPGLADAHFNLAEACLATGRDGEALAAAERALALDARHSGAALDRGLALAALARFDEADAALAHAAALGAALPRSDGGWIATAREIHLVRGYDRLEACDWASRDDFLARFRALVHTDADPDRPLASPALAFRAMMLGLPADDQLRLARKTAARIAAAAPRLDAPAAADRRRPAERLRIGYVSADFGDHPTAHLAAPLFERHDRGRCEILAYALNPEDGSAYRRRIAAASDCFLDASGMALAELATRIAQDGVDVLVNMNGYTTGHRTALFAMRPAPVQASYLAYPATMGAPFMDYLVADPVVIPAAAAGAYSEAIAWLPVCYQVNDADALLDARPPHASAGLPAAAFVFCDFNQHAKITPAVFAAWMRILHRVAGSVLWLLDGPGRANLAAHARAAGIAPERLVFAPRLPRAEHLARLQLADLFLDTRPTNAHTTAADALLAGVPVLTCPAESFAGRVAASLVRAAALDALVADDLDAYEAAAVELAADPARLAGYREHLRSGRRSLAVFDADARARELEQAYAEMDSRRRRGLAPESFRVAPARTA